MNDLSFATAASSLNILRIMDSISVNISYRDNIINKSFTDCDDDTCYLCKGKEEDFQLIPTDNNIMQSITCKHTFHRHCLYKIIKKNMTEEDCLCPVENCNKQIICSCDKNDFP